VFTNSTADALFDINMRLLQADLKLNFVAFSGDFLKRAVRNNFEGIFGICHDFAAVIAMDSAEIIAGGKSAGHEGLVNFDGIIGNLHYCQGAVSYGVEALPGIDCLGADGTVFLTDDAGLIHCPWQAPVAVKEGGAELDWPGFGEFIVSELFCKCNGSDGGCRADLPASDAV